MSMKGGMSKVGKEVIGVAVALLIWAIIGILALQTLGTANVTGIPAVIVTVAVTLVGVVATIGVMLKFLE